MRLYYAIGVVALATTLWSPYSSAQPADPRSGDNTSLESKGASTQIPVSMPGGTEVLSAESAASSSAAAPVALEQPIDPEKYICGAGDVFELNFWGQQNFRLRVAADLEGRTFISKVGFVDVQGKTLSEVRTRIKQKVKSYYPGLQFDLTLHDPRTFQIHIAGSVAKPGPYTTSPLERVSSVLARAGGITGSRRRISIRHRSGSPSTADLVLYEQTGDTSLNPFLLDGDVVTVPFNDVQVTITGAVRRPGTYELIKTKDLTEALSLAGGISSSAARKLPIRVIKRDKNQQEVSHDVAMTAEGYGAEPLSDGDKIDVRDVGELQRTVLMIGAVAGADPLDTATMSKRLAYVEGDTVLSLLERAGGIRSTGDLTRSYISRARPGQAPEVIPVDLDALLVRRDFKADRQVKLGDAIVIPPMRYSVLVEGAVARAGLYNYNPSFGVSQYIAHAGGRTRTARALDEVQVIDANGNTHSYKDRLKPSPGDAILVPERNFSRSEIVQIVIAGAGLVLSGVAITLAATR